MAKEKKIKIKYYLNKKLKSKEIDDEICFPIYVMIIYNRNSYNYKLGIGGKGVIYAAEGKGLKDKRFTQFSNELEKEEDRIRRIIRYEEVRMPSFSLAGFSKRLVIYEIGLKEFFEKSIIFFASEVAKKKLSYNDYIEYTKIEEVIEMISTITPFLSQEKKEDLRILSYGLYYGYLNAFLLVTKTKKVTIYDWIFNGFRTKMSDFQKKIENFNQSKPETKKSKDIESINELEKKKLTEKITIVEELDDSIHSLLNNINAVKMIWKK